VLIEVKKRDFRYIYGPVSSWRLGASLGVDLLSSARKICTFDCIYCQVGKTLRFTNKPRVYVKTQEIISELENLPRIKIDYITFSGRGEPSLAENLGEAIGAVKRLNLAPVAVLTNSSLINQERVRKGLYLSDFVIAKLDAYSQESLQRINQPAGGIKFESILQGIKQFKKGFRGKFALQIMFVEENKEGAKDLSRLVREINPDEVQINTPLRPCRVKPLSREEINRIKGYFYGLNFVSVYDVGHKRVVALSKEETLRRRGKNSV
jgi:wyosine [tRNA(Phe)-imidazoG37] synthetase (radical SAM superfamily)